MTTIDWTSVFMWYERIQDADEARRAAWLRQLQDQPEPIQQAVRQMLAADAHDSFMQQPPLTRLTPGDSERTMLGQYQLLNTVAVGGMGQVYQAVNTAADVAIHVALKVIRKDLADDSLTDRFAREKSILSRLQHPHIARLVDSGLADGEPYLATEWVDGVKLSQYIRDHNPELSERLQLFLHITAAVAHAHNQLILHRDLKPDNIMIDAHQQVKLLDFGIARMLDPQVNETGSTQMFTPEYAAPEQVTGQPSTVQTDVYALGLVLYYLITGRPRFDFRELPWQARIEAITEPKPISPGEPLANPAGKSVKPDLALIINQACHPQPARRYTSVAALAEDVNRFIHHRPVVAAGDDWWYRSRLFFKRHTLASALISFSLFSLLLGLGFSQQARLEARQSETLAIREAEKNRQIRLFYDALLQQASPIHGGNTELSFREVLTGTDPDYDIHDIDDELLKAEIAAQIASLYGQYGETARRFEHASLAREVYQRHLPERVDSYVNISNNMALNTLKNGEPETAIELLRQTLKTIKNHTPDAAELTETHITLGQALGQSGDHEQAKNHYVLARTLAEPINYREGLGKIDYYQTFLPGLSDAEKWLALQSAEQHFTAALPDTHPNLLSIRNSLAVLFKDRGDYQAAEQLLRLIGQAEKQQSGQVSINTLINHADSLFYLGQTQAAQDIIQQALTQLDEQAIDRGISRLSATIIAGRIHADLLNHELAAQLLTQAQSQITEQWPGVAVFQLIMDSYLLELSNKAGAPEYDRSWTADLEHRTAQLDTSVSRNRRIALNAYLALAMWHLINESPKAAELIESTRTELSQQPARQGWPLHVLEVMQPNRDADRTSTSLNWLQSQYTANHLYLQLPQMNRHE